MNEQPNKKAKTRFAGFMEEKGFYIILFLCVLAIGITGYVFFFSNPADDGGAEPAVSDTLMESEGTENLPVYSPDDALPETQVSALDDASEAAGESPEPATEAADMYTSEQAQAAAKAAAEQLASGKSKPSVNANFFVRPVPGAVAEAFSGDELVYNRTTGDWRTHNGVDFEAADGEQVCAIADGTVEDIYTDSYYGTCILIDHGGGLKSTYAGLMEGAAVKKGQTITAGTVIGAVNGDTLFENAMPVHLHVEVTRDGKRVNPMSVIPS